MAKISRAQFLRGDWRGNKPDLRPPWAHVSGCFESACDSCGDCIKACPQNILELPSSGIPRVNFGHGECTFCGDCLAACPTGALCKEDGSQPWQLTARISDKCLAMNGTSCERCIESCEADAIVARPALHGRMLLHVDADCCTGCGACVAGCPVQVISVQHSNPEMASG